MLKRIITRRQPLTCLGDVDAAGHSLPPLLKRVYENRQIKDLNDLDYRLARLHPPHDLKGAATAVDLLVQCLLNEKKILILGDYDADGASAVALGILALKEMGYINIDYLVPNRFDYGYGLSREIAEVTVSMSPDVVITVDNGISSVAGVQFLRNHRIQVIVTDHHLPAEVLPDADAIVNPNQKGCCFPSKTLAGVGVMFYLLSLLREKLVQMEWFVNQNRQKPNLAKYLDLVALGTVADMVPLDYNNRILVHQGLLRIRAGRCRLGILALLRTVKKQYQSTCAADFAFFIAPRINAAGRLDDISTGIECLLSENHETALFYAELLNDINTKRKQVEKEMQLEAFAIINALGLSEQENNNIRGYCLFNSSWHQGITGLVASKVKQKTQQPTIVFAETGNGMLTASGRSVDNLHLKDLLESISKEHPDLLKRFGGHAMAVGLTIESSKLAIFQSIYHQKVASAMAEVGICCDILTDGELNTDELVLDQAEKIRFAEPWGNHFPEPVFDGVFYVENQQLVGGVHLKMKLRHQLQSTLVDAIVFNIIQANETVDEFECIKIVYRLDVNEFMGRKKLQLVIEYLEKVEVG